MAKQSEQILEEQRIAQLQKLGHGSVALNDEAAAQHKALCLKNCKQQDARCGVS